VVPGPRQNKPKTAADLTVAAMAGTQAAAVATSNSTS
jgi:hypothetical protein